MIAAQFLIGGLILAGLAIVAGIVADWIVRKVWGPK